MMGKISEVVYEEINPEEYSKEDIGEYYYLFNMLDASSSIYYEVEKYNSNKIELRNKIVKNIKDKFNGNISPRSSIFGFSSIKDKAIMIVNVL